MPFEITLDHANRLVIFTGSGAGSVEEIAESVGRAMRSVTAGAVPSDYGVLVITDATAMEPTAEETQRISRLLAMLRTVLRGPVAIVAASVGMALPAQLVALTEAGSNDSVRAFESEAAARAWLKTRTESL